VMDLVARSALAYTDQTGQSTALQQASSAGDSAALPSSTSIMEEHNLRWSDDSNSLVGFACL